MLCFKSAAYQLTCIFAIGKIILPICLDVHKHVELIAGALSLINFVAVRAEQGSGLSMLRFRVIHNQHREVGLAAGGGGWGESGGGRVRVEG